MLEAFAVLIARVGGAGAIAAGEPADDGVDTAGEAIVSDRPIRCRIGGRKCQKVHQGRDNMFKRDDSIVYGAATECKAALKLQKTVRQMKCGRKVVEEI
jgi:hypothetical protein